MLRSPVNRSAVFRWRSYSPTQKRLGIVVIAVPRKQTELVLADLKMFLLIIYPLSLLLLFLMSRTIAGRSLIPVQTMISTAQRITRENLAVRIELPPNKDELTTLASTINDLLERIESALTRERQLTADVAHELRTPLAALKGTMEVLIRRPRAQEHYERKISYCIGEVNRLSALVDQVLMLARFEKRSGSSVLCSRGTLNSNPECDRQTGPPLLYKSLSAVSSVPKAISMFELI